MEPPFKGDKKGGMERLSLTLETVAVMYDFDIYQGIN